MSRFINPFPQFFDDSGDVLTGGSIAFYDSGTTELKAIYADAAFAIPLQNPVPLDGAGGIPSLYLDGAYRVVLLDKNGVQQKERDPVTSNRAGEVQFDAYLITQIYGKDDIVVENSRYYISLVDDNQGNNPATSLAEWAEISFATIWNPNKVYNTGEIAIFNSAQYSSLVDGNINLQPDQNPSEWQENGLNGALLASNNLSDVLDPAAAFDNIANIPNVKSDSTNSNNSDVLATSKAVRDLNNAKANTSGTYSGLRAQATTKSDVGLSNIPNSTSSSVTSTSTSTLATSSAAKTAYDRGSSALSTANVNAVAIAAIKQNNSIPSLCLLGLASNSSISYNATYSGSSLRASGFRQKTSTNEVAGSGGFRSSGMSGTWRALGNASNNGDSSTRAVTLFVRIS